MMQEQDIVRYIRRRSAEGSSEKEIRSELQAKGLTEAEITHAITLVVTTKERRTFPWPIILSTLILAVGAWQWSAGNETWGYILMGYGLVTLCIRILQRTRR